MDSNGNAAILGLDLEARAKLAFDRWRRGNCVYLCLICKKEDRTFGSSLGLEMHLVSKHRIGIREHRQVESLLRVRLHYVISHGHIMLFARFRYGPARILTDEICCRLCPGDRRIIYEQRQLSVHFKRKHKETSLLK